MSWFPWNLCALLAIYEDNQSISQGNNRWKENSHGNACALPHIRNFQTLKFYHPNDLICTRIRDSKHFRIPNPSSKKKKQQSFPKTSQDMGVRHYVIMYWFVSKKAGIPRFIALSFTSFLGCPNINTATGNPWHLGSSESVECSWQIRSNHFLVAPKSVAEEQVLPWCVCVCVFFNWVKTDLESSTNW